MYGLYLVITGEGEAVTVYVDGEFQDTQSCGAASLSNTTFRIGSWENTTGFPTHSGYLSDYYLIDGAVLPPETFGRDFAAGWGPLDSSVVLDNLKIKTSLYDTRPNMDEKWSEEGTATNWSTGDYVFANAFKGTIFVSGGNNSRSCRNSLLQQVDLMRFGI